MHFAFVTIILQLIFLECILSIDNAAVLGAMVAPLPADKPVPWPRSLKPLLGRLDPVLGAQREAALKVGLLGAYAGRILMLFLASIIIRNVWMQIVGALYLIYLAVRHFGEAFRHAADGDNLDQANTARAAAMRGGFWGVVLTIELADLAFSLDNVVAAVALSDQLWVVVLGVAVGILVMRFAAQIFTRLIAWEPALESAAYLLLLWIGGALLLEHYLEFELGEWSRFAVSVSIIVLVVILARVKPLRPLVSVFRPFGWIFAVINDGVSLVFGFLAMPFRRREPKVN